MRSSGQLKNNIGQGLLDYELIIITDDWSTICWRTVIVVFYLAAHIRSINESRLAVMDGNVPSHVIGRSVDVEYFGRVFFLKPKST